MSHQDSQIPTDHGAETSGDHGAQTASDQGIQTPADDPHGDAAIAAIGTQAAAQASMENLPQEKGKMFFPLRIFDRNELLEVCFNCDDRKKNKRTTYYLLRKRYKIVTSLRRGQLIR